MLDAVSLDGVESHWIDTSVVEMHAPFVYGGHVDLGPAMTDPQTRRAFSPLVMAAHSVRLRMREVILEPRTAFVFKGRALVDQTRYKLRDSDENDARAWLSQPHGRFEGRRAFVGFNRWCLNYFHTVTQILPAIAAYENEPGFRDGALLVRVPTPILRRGLELAGITGPEFVTIGQATPLAVEDLTFCSLLTGCEGPSLFSRRIFDRMIANAGAGRAPGRPRMIYAWRVDGRSRPLRNEDELVEMLARHGVEPIILSSLTLDEQIRLFHSAELIVGPHGAGLSNVVFGSPGAVLYELLPDHYMNPCMNQLAQMRGLHYWCDVHPSANLPGVWRHQMPWSVDIDAVERRLLQIKSMHGL